MDRAIDGRATTANVDALEPYRASKFLVRSGLTSKRNLYWFYKQVDGLNFGDWIGPYLFEKITNRRPVYFDPRKRSLGTYISGCGSILGHIRQPREAIVWGSGAIKADTTFAPPKRILAVRGPLSRQICLAQNFECPAIFGDPGILLPKFYNPVRPSKKHPLGIVPHFTEHDLARRLFAQRDDVLIIDVRRGVEAVVADILACKTIVSSSLHGVIIAQAYGIQAGWAVISDQVIGGTFKFEDYFLGVGFDRPQKPIVIDVEEPQSTEQLIAAANSTQLVDVRSIADRLLDTCPF